jgi:hypothetical protein
MACVSAPSPIIRSTKRRGRLNFLPRGKGKRVIVKEAQQNVNTPDANKELNKELGSGLDGLLLKTSFKGLGHAICRDTTRGISPSQKLHE